MSSPQSFLALILLQQPDLRVPDNTQLILTSATCLAAAGVFFGLTVLNQRVAFLFHLPLPLGDFKGTPFLTIAGWINEYGPLITIRSNFERIVIIGRYKAAVEIMEGQGKFVADRPRMIVAGEIVSGGMSIALAPFGDRFRRMRSALHSHLQPKAAEAYQPLQMSHVKNIVLGVLDNPQNLQHHVITYAATTIMKAAYGKNTPTSATDPEMVAKMRPGAYLVDSIPWLRYLPWYGRELKLGFERRKILHTNHMEWVKEQMQSDQDIVPSFMKHMLENSQSYDLTEAEMAFLGGSFLGAGSISRRKTSVSICTVLMAAACFPDERAGVRAKLDAVIGRHRAPTFIDQGSLPRLQAFISEALRWRPVPSGGFPHRTTNRTYDDLSHQENYCIPAGTTVFGDHWSISRDSDVYPEPHASKPQRWIDEQGGLRDDLNFFVYGFGRRACPGQHVADRSVFIATLLVLWAYKLTLDPTQPWEVLPCTFEFKKRIPEMELRSMLQHYPKVV
ncbi:cytochrome P450 [Suillus subaureus]|uniref:Cytochrome P450 n=1 Tax=Suillus subaureus TaxID=48587 RepID=A0A9P7J8C5_9AGAM|nr:cytochrome P450 [Suillus subaureus]KAG1807776.1 cytochrome P450 [Suillus subaureus]